MSNSDFDYDVVDPNASEQTVPVYPVAQWHNGQQALKALGGVQFSGGVVLPEKYLSDGSSFPGWTKERMTFRSGKEENALTAHKISIAPIRTRFRWFARQGSETAYYPRNAFVMGANMRGHLQVLAAVQGASEPVVITFKGKASQAFESLLKDFGAKVVQAANRQAPKGKALPRYAFWMPIAPGPHTKAGGAGHESVVTLPTLGLAADITPEYLRSLYIGRDSLIRFQEWHQEAGAWVDAWEKSGMEHGEIATDHDEEPDGGQAQKPNVL
ncbi:MAG: hypothetical protein M0Z89_09000 [Nitrospiraceae bacterium]|nr:hypothetical protein [Nitrospiraceae bacterium]